MIDLIRQGIDLYGKLTSSSTDQIDGNSKINNTNNSNKQIDVHHLLVERFHDIENKFKNLLIEGVSFEIFLFYYRY